MNAWQSESFRPAGRTADEKTPLPVQRSLLSSWLQLLFGLLAALAVTGAVITSAYNHIVSGNGPSDYSWSDPVNERTNIVLIGTRLGIAAFVLLLVWAFKAHQVTDALHPVGRSWRRGWVIGSWLIPVFNLVGPQLVLSEMDRIARSDRTRDGVVPQWRRSRANPIGWAWWVLLVIGSILQVSGSVVEGSATSVGAERSAYVLYSIGFVCWAVSSVCGLFYVRGLAGRLATVGVLPAPRSTSWDPPMPNAAASGPAGAVGVYSTLNWSAEEVHDVHQTLTERGVEHRFEHGDLVVDVALAPLADRAIAELVVSPQHLDPD